MSKVRVHNFAMSLDGFVAGPNQSADKPLGQRGTELHDWLFATAAGRIMLGIVPILLGAGERLFEDLDGGPVGYECTEMVSTDLVTHVRLTRTAG